MLAEVWVWLFFLLGMVVYWSEIAYNLVQGPNPLVTSYPEFFKRCWMPLLVRFFIDSLAFWILFTPGIADKALGYLGWSTYSWLVLMITQVAPIAGVFGFVIDAILPRIVNSIPFLKDLLPQMPAVVPPKQ